MLAAVPLNAALCRLVRGYSVGPTPRPRTCGDSVGARQPAPSRLTSHPACPGDGARPTLAIPSPLKAPRKWSRAIATTAPDPSRLLNMQTGCSVKPDLRRRGYGHAPPPTSSPRTEASSRPALEQNGTGDDRLPGNDADTNAGRGPGRVRARRAFPAWSRLSDATHPCPYELAPTAGELRRWHSEVTSLVGLLDPSAGHSINSADDDERML
jgi:hypothetical protein